MMKEYLNRNFAIVWFILTVFAVFFWLIIGRRFNLSDLITYSTYSCLLYLIYNSRSLRSKNEIIYLSGNLILIIGIFFKIMHWPFADALLMFAPFVIILGYFIFFYKNTNKTWLDILKLCWISIASGSIVWVILKMPFPELIENITIYMVWPIYFGVAWYEWRGLDQSETTKIQETENNLPEDVL
jgi:hypothetical protein